MRVAILARMILVASLLAAFLPACSKRHDDAMTSPIDESILPPVPINLTLSPGNARLTLSWSLPVGGLADGFRVYRAEIESEFAAIASVASTAFSYVDHQVVDGTRYRYRVAALRDNLEGLPSLEITAVSGPFGILLEGGVPVTAGNSVQFGSRRIAVDLQAPDNTVRFQLSEDSTFVGAQEQAFVAENPRAIFTLSPGDGTKTVYGRFFGSNGESSEIVRAWIRLDTRALILSVTENSGGQILLAGDTLHVTLAADTTGGMATVDLGNAIFGFNLFDDGTTGDPVAFDGTYEADYVVEPGVEVVEGAIKGRFIDDIGNEADRRAAPTRVTIACPPSRVLFRRSQVVVRGNAVTLRWGESQASDFAAYRLFRSPPNDTDEITSDDLIVADVADRGVREFTDVGLVPGASYKWGLAVVDARGFLSPLDSITVTVDFTPVIPATTLTPTSGTTATTFTYRATYQHPQGRAPAVVLLIVDELVTYPMPQQGTGTDWVGGEDFALGINLQEGPHTFHFEAEDVDGARVRSPEEGVFGGPLVFP